MIFPRCVISFVFLSYLMMWGLDFAPWWLAELVMLFAIYLWTLLPDGQDWAVGSLKEPQ